MAIKFPIMVLQVQTVALKNHLLVLESKLGDVVRSLRILFSVIYSCIKFVKLCDNVRYSVLLLIFQIAKFQILVETAVIIMGVVV